MTYCITNGIIHTGETLLHGQNILVSEGIITAITNEIPSEAIVHNLEGKQLAAGLIDLHINGGTNQFFTEKPTTEAIADITNSSLLFGTSAVLPCLISSSHQNILEAINNIGISMQTNPGVLGMHLEGPFINPEKKGAHIASLIRKPTDEELYEILEQGQNVIKIMTIAPECFTDGQLKLLLSSGIHISIGHSALTCQQATRYFDMGIRLVTHLYNAMTQFGHREPGLVGAVFNHPGVYAPIILDGQHCDYVAAKIAYQLKGDHLFLVSDAAFLGRKVTTYHWGEFNMTLTADGHYRNAAGNLACSAISMQEAVKNARDHLGITTEEAIKMATCYPAKAIGMQDKIGYIKPGYPARFACFDESLEVMQSWLYS